METIKNCVVVYEVPNPSFLDMCLEQQIEVGVNDWRAENIVTGVIGFGKTAAEATINVGGCK